MFEGEAEASHAVADKRYRLVRYASGQKEFHDLRADPDEFTNRAGEREPGMGGGTARLPPPAGSQNVPFTPTVNWTPWVVRRNGLA
jgi:hypothetical protein